MAAQDADRSEGSAEKTGSDKVAKPSQPSPDHAGRPPSKSEATDLDRSSSGSTLIRSEVNCTRS